MITKFDTGQIVYVPVKIDKVFQAGGRLLYTIKHGDYEFEVKQPEEKRGCLNFSITKVIST